jgi:heptosyltransferase I
MMTALGDAVHVLPVITALKRHNPRCRITWVLQPGPAKLVRDHPDVDDIVLFDKSRGTRAFLDVRDEMARRPIDLVLGLQVYMKAGIATALIDAPVKLGFDRKRARDLNWLFTTHRIPPHAQQHVQDQYFEFLEYLHVPHEPVVWNLGPWPDELDRQRAFFAPFDRPAVALVVGTSKPEKDWIAERWATLHDLLIDRFDLRPVVLGGGTARELETARRIREMVRHAPVEAMGGPLRDMVGILEGSALVISLDTGPLHMAVALDRPVISLMGYNNPKRVGPYRKFHDLIVDAYGDPGEDYPVTPAHRHDRMPRIRVEDVVAKVERWQERYAAYSRAGRRPSTADR